MIDVQNILSALKEVGLSDWIEEWDVRNIYQAVGKIPAGGVYFEVGVAHGASLSVASLAARDGVFVGGVDRASWPDRDYLIGSFLDKFNKKSVHKFFEDDSQLLAKTGLGIDKPIDVLFIDGDHTYEGTLRDIASWVPWVAYGGVILFDDYNDLTGVKKAVNETIFNHRAYNDFRVDGEMFFCRKI